MIEGLIVHPAAAAALAAFAASPAHAVLLTGANGIGKGTVAARLAAQLLNAQLEKLSDHPYVRIVQPDGKNTISIEAVRNLQQFLQLKSLGTATLRRSIIIEHADRLTGEAQNAFLKVLEEPPADTVIIMTAGNPRHLLPTILSRTQVIQLPPPSEAAVREYFAKTGHDTAAITQSFFLSGGLPGLMAALLANEAHPLLKSVTTAKVLLSKTTFERLAAVETLSKQKDEAVAVIEALGHIAQTMLDQAAKQGETAKVKQWHRILKLAAAAQAGLANNGNTKLILSNTMLHM
jgi:DNA polymerase III subunit delta'